MRPLFRLVEIVFDPAQNNVVTKFYKLGENLFDIQHLRLAVHQRQHDHAKRRLQLRVFKQLLQDEFGIRFLAQLEHDAHAFAVRLVADVVNTLNFFIADQIRHAFDQRRLVDLIGDLVHDNTGAAVHVFRMNLGTNGEFAAPGFEIAIDLFIADNERTGGKVRPFDVFFKIDRLELRLFNQRYQGIDDLVKIVRRHVGGHADRDAGRAVDQQRRQQGGENRRFLQRIVKICHKGDRVLFQIAQNLLSYGRETSFRITHRRRRVAVDRAKITLSVHQRIAQGKILHHSHHSVVHGRIAVRVIFS